MGARSTPVTGASLLFRDGITLKATHACLEMKGDTHLIWRSLAFMSTRSAAAASRAAASSEKEAARPRSALADLAASSRLLLRSSSAFHSCHIILRDFAYSVLVLVVTITRLTQLHARHNQLLTCFDNNSTHMLLSSNVDITEFKGIDQQCFQRPTHQVNEQGNAWSMLCLSAAHPQREQKSMTLGSFASAARNHISKPAHVLQLLHVLLTACASIAATSALLPLSSFCQGGGVSQITPLSQKGWQQVYGSWSVGHISRIDIVSKLRAACAWTECVLHLRDAITSGALEDISKALSICHPLLCSGDPFQPLLLACKGLNCTLKDSRG